MADFKEQGEGSRPQNPEWKHDFTPGPNEEDVARFRGNEGRMELGGEGEGGETPPPPGFPEWWNFPRNGERGDFERSKLAIGWEPIKLVNLLVEMGDLEISEPKGPEGEAKKTEKEQELRKELDRSFRMATGAGQDRVAEIADMVERLQEPFPYLSQPQIRFFESADQALTSLVRYYDGELPERVSPWFRRIDETLTQQQGLLKVILAAGASTSGYYDAVKQLGETLIDRQRFHATSADMRSAFAEEDPGVTVQIGEGRKHIEGTFAEREPRKRQVEDINTARMFVLANHAVAQMDILDTARRIDKSGNVVNRDTFMSLSENKIRFIKLLFGDLNEDNWITYQAGGRTLRTPKNIETWYADKDILKSREDWLTKMIAIVEWKEGGLNLWDSLDTKSGDQVLDLASQIRQKADGIRGLMGDKIAGARFERGAAKIATALWIETDKAFMVSGRLGWKFTYAVEGGVVRRHKDTGGIYKAYDSFNAMYPWEKYLGYKASWKSTSQFFVASADWMRREKMIHRPDWMPDLKEWLKKDKRMARIWETLFSPRFREFRARRLAGKGAGAQKLEEARKVADLDPEIARYLQENAYAYVTAYKNVNGENVALPMFIPRELEFINVWKYLLIEEDETDEHGNKRKVSVWDKMCDGVRPSRINWEKVNFETLDRMWVSMNMLVRFLKLWIDPYEAEKDPFLNAFFRDASTQSVSELSKRIFLTFRDLPQEGAYINLMAAIVPFSIAQYEASQSGILGTTLGTNERPRNLKKWNFRISQWVRALRWLPNVIYDNKTMHMEKDEIERNAEIIKNMGNGLALILITQKMFFERIGQAAFAADRDALARVYNDLIRVHKDSDLEGALTPEGKEPIIEDAEVREESFQTTSEHDFKRKTFGE